MKTLLGFVLVLVTLGAWAQTTPPLPIPQDVISNMPTVSLGQERFSLAVGATLRSGSLENVVSARYDLPKGFALAGEVQMGPSANVIDSLALEVQYRKILSDAFEFYGLAGIRRDWARARWEGLLGGGASWLPAASAASLSFLGKTTTYIEERGVIDSFKDQPAVETVAGLRWSF